MIKKCLIRLALPVLILVVVTRAQDDSSGEHYSEDHYFPDSDSDNTPVDSGFVTPLDFTPLFADGAYGIAPARASPAPVAAIGQVAHILQVPQQQSQYALAFDTVAAGSHSVLQPRQAASEEHFSPASFGYKTFFAQLSPAQQKPAALQQQPQIYQHNIIQYDRSKGLSQSGSLINNPPQYNIQTKHDPTYNIHRPDQNDDKQQILTALKSNPAVAAYFKPPSTNIEVNHQTDLHTNDDNEPQYQRYKTKHVVPRNANYKDHTYVSGAHSSPTHRVRRYTGQRNNKQSSNKHGRNQEDDDSPYSYHSEYVSRPKTFDTSPYSSSYKSADDDEKEDDPYKYDYGKSGYNFDEYERIKNLSEKQAAEIKENPENCKEVIKDSMKCMVCANPKTGGNYESCAYVSEPKNNKYAYMKERKYDSNDDPESGEKEEVVKQDDESKQPEKYQKSSQQKSSSSDEAKTDDKEEAKPTPSRKPYDSSYKPPTQYEKLKQYEEKKPYQGYQREPSENKSSGKYAYYPSSHKSAHYTDASNDDEKEKKSAKKNENPYEYKNPIPGFYSDNEPKKDVEQVLAEFAKKDRSACKKVYKNGMTCYQCIDKRGLKNEECMFVQESAPKRSHLAYQELKEFTSKPETIKADGHPVAESQTVTTSNPLPKKSYSAALVATEQYGQKLNRREVLPDVYTTTASTVIPRSQSGQITSTHTPGISSRSSDSIYPRKAQITKRSNPKKEGSEEPEVATPKESNIAPPEDFAGANSKGAFWAEIVPRYSRYLGVSLPEYMLSKSEHEKSFDEAVSGG